VPSRIGGAGVHHRNLVRVQKPIGGGIETKLPGEGEKAHRKVAAKGVCEGQSRGGKGAKKNNWPGSGRKGQFCRCLGGCFKDERKGQHE